MLDVDGGYGDAVVARLRRFLLRSKVELERSPGAACRCAATAWRRRRPACSRSLAERGVLALPFAWNGWTGVDLLGPRGRRARPGRRPRCPTASSACGAAGRGGLPHRLGHPRHGHGAHRQDHRGRGRAGGPDGQLHQGLLHRVRSSWPGSTPGASNVARRLVGVVAPAGRPRRRWPAGMTLHAGDAPAGDGAAEDKVVGTITSAAWSSEAGGVGGPGLPAPQRRGARARPGALGRRGRRLAPGTGQFLPLPPARRAPGGLRGRAVPLPAAEGPPRARRPHHPARRADRRCSWRRPTPWWRRRPPPSPCPPTS